MTGDFIATLGLGIIIGGFLGYFIGLYDALRK